MSLRVVAFGGWDRGAAYPRSPALLDGLRAQGADVTECHVDLPYHGETKRRLVASPWRWPSYWWKLRRLRARARVRLRRAIEEVRPDVILVPYPGHLTVHWAREVFDGPILLDLFLSAFDTAVGDRQLFGSTSFPARILRRMDRRACMAADRVIVDTPQNAAHLAELLDLSVDRFRFVPVSDPLESAGPLDYSPPDQGQRLELLFFGTGVPLHGLSVLLDAIQRTTGVRLTLVGGSGEDRDRARELGSERVLLLDEFLSPGLLRGHIQDAHLVAGVFGTGKADRVIPLKVMLALSAGRPAITADTTAVRSLLNPGVDCLVVPPANPAAVAHELEQLRDDPRRLAAIAAAARQAYEDRFSLAVTGARLRKLCDELVQPRSVCEGAEFASVP